MEALIGLMILGIVIGITIKVWNAPYTPTIWDRAGVTKQTYKATVKQISSPARVIELE